MSITQKFQNFEPFNCEPLHPKDVKNILKSANLKFSPGPDGNPYEILFKFNCLHHMLATLYNKVNVLGSPPPSWLHHVVKLLHKKGPINDPGNFHMIFLTSSIAKTYLQKCGIPPDFPTVVTFFKEFLRNFSRIISCN